jgi:hypothetical protein
VATKPDLATDARAVEILDEAPIRRIATWSRRHRGLVGAAAAVLLFAVAGLAAALLSCEEEQTQPAVDGADSIHLGEATGLPEIRGGLARDPLERGWHGSRRFALGTARDADGIRRGIRKAGSIGSSTDWVHDDLRLELKEPLEQVRPGED